MENSVEVKGALQDMAEEIKARPAVQELTEAPLGNRVIVKALEPESVTKSGIFIPDTAKEKPTKGIVMAVGPEVDTDKECNVGDIVSYSKYSGTEITIDGDEYLVIRSVDFITRKKY